MSERAVQTRNALIQAAIEEIERVGLPRITVRGIATRAKANVAAINYHFGSKDGLVQAVLDATRTHMFDDVDAILGRSMTAEEALGGAPPARSLSADEPARTVLRELMTYLLSGSARYPNLARAQAQVGLKGRSSSALNQEFERLVPRMAKVICAAVPTLSLDAAEGRSAAALSSILFLGFFPEFFGAASPKTPAARERYINAVVDGLLAPGPRSKRARRG